MRRRFDSHKCLDVRPWVIAAINDESRYPPDRLWKKEPTADHAYHDRLKRIKFLHKHSKTDAKSLVVADRLESCEPEQRCLSGACPECGRLFQRWFVRRSKKFIATHIDRPGHDLVAISLVPSDLLIRPGYLSALNIRNFIRRAKLKLKKAGVDVALGGMDFSFNEDQKQKYLPFWCPHFYLITSTKHKKTLSKELCKLFPPKQKKIPRPLKITSFKNKAFRRSYALKMNFKRRIGYNDIKKTRKCRNASGDRLRATERLELFIYLDQIGLSLGGCGCLNRISASISGGSAGVRPPRGKAAS
jgi:hypothetical protein